MSTDYVSLSEADGCSSWSTGGKPCAPDIVEMKKKEKKKDRKKGGGGREKYPTLTYCSLLSHLQRAEFDPSPSPQ